MLSSYLYIWIACFGTEQGHHLYFLFILFEVFFFINMVLNFLTDFVREGENIPVQDINEIVYHYFSGDFVWDFMPLVPFSFFLDNGVHSFLRLFFCVKVLRVKTGFNSFDVGKIYHFIKRRFTQNLKNKIKNHPEIA
jgi:hypothetical protein